MKKLFILSLAALLALAFGSAYAQEKAPVLDFKASGYFAIENNWGRNYTSAIFSPTARDKSISWTALRGRLMFNANMGKELSGTIFFEMDGNPWGAGPGSNDPGTGQRGALTYWSADRAAVEIKWLYFDIAVPYIPVPVTIRIGEQGVGPRFLLQSIDMAAITTNIDLDPVKLALYWGKAAEGATQNADDSDMYGINASAKLGTVTVGGYGMYYNFNSYPIWVKTTAADITYANGTRMADFWYFGAYADGKMGPVNVNFDFVYDRGKDKSREPDVNDVKYRGWAAWLRVDYPWDIFNFGFGGFYATGDNKSDVDKHKGFVSPPLSEGNAPFGEAFIYAGVPGSPIGGLGAFFFPASYSFTNAGYGGSWFVRASVKARVTPIYNVTARAYYIGDTTKNGDTWGSAVDDFGNFTNNKSIGWELDMINSIKIYKNLEMLLAAGVFKSGNAMKFMNADGFAQKPKTSWLIYQALNYSF